MRAHLITTGVAVAGTVGAALTTAGVRSPVTGAFTLLFLLVTPAVCVARLLPRCTPAARAIVSGTAALVLVSAVAEVMLAASVWSPRGGIVTVGVACAVIAAIPLIRQRLDSRRDGRAVAKPDDHSAGDDDESWAFDA